MASIPTTIDDVDPAWLSEATGLSIEGVEPEIIGVGIGVSSAVYRLSLTGDAVPETMILKLSALDEAAVFTSSILRMYEREVKFFDELAARSPIRVPKSYGGAVGDDGSTYFLLMEDMGSHRVVDQNEGMELADAEQAVDELARWHAEFWGDADRYVECGAVVSLADEIYTSILPMVFGEGWAKLQAEMDIHPAIAEVAPRWIDRLPAMLASLSSNCSTTVVHGDYRADNILFDENRNVVLLDFQLTGLATPAYDLAYFVTQSLVPDVAATNERTLFERYVAGLHRAGVSEAETGNLWENYRTAALFCLVYPVVASRGMDLTDARQYQLVDNMNRRCARAIESLELDALL